MDNSKINQTQLDFNCGLGLANLNLKFANKKLRFWKSKNWIRKWLETKYSTICFSI